MTRYLPGAFAALTATVLLLTIPAQAASAHDNLLEASPAAGDTVTQLHDLTLTFSGELIDFSEASYAQLQGPDGLYYELSCSRIDRNILTTPVALGEPGTYTVTWNAVSSDGHPVSERYDFTYTPSPGAEPALGWNKPACGNEEDRVQPVATPTAVPTPTETSASDTAAPTSPHPSSAQAAAESTPPIAIPLIAAAIIIGVGVASVPFIMRRGRKQHGGH